ncbi:D-alanyl-D-alanine carboxypeptidase family protein [Clostridium vincentii]|uniref:serine-type D-Ala-D-Ala carboxypeptidase n=1 Tax=Clostridium vincentii TaxID=52704 RepID=A0A2T0BET2_9CLOT|nr:D-alanyl-D-alanine carboxypeptidase family protein [Clostridium vincentii]PRR82389.1 D-alanyl-D-alanine carboxypeptidase DacB precursor [Clostridium vincentii]
MNKLKMYLNILICFVVILIVTTLIIPSIASYATAEPPQINSEGATLMDATTGQILYSKNGDTNYFPASITKVLTALVVLENTKLDDKVTVGEKPPFADGTSVGIKTGEIFTVHQLLLGLLLESGNDCAEALAEHVSGSCEEFAKLMTERAKKLGTKSSTFKNPSGLPDPEHVTTSNDYSLIMKEIIKNPDFLDIDKTTNLQLPTSNLGEQRIFNNRNYILLKNSNYYYPFSIASKKGYTIDAKFTNVISATKDGRTLIVTSLKGEDINKSYEDATNLLNYGFDNFTKVTLYSQGDIVDSISLSDGTSLPLLASKDIYYTVKTGDQDTLDKSVDYEAPTDLDNKSLTRGEILTKGKVILNGEEIQDIELASGISRDSNAKMTLASFFENYTTIIVLLGGGIVILFVIKTINRRKRIRERIRRSRINQILNK